MQPGSSPGARFTPQLLLGLLVIAVGVLFTLDNLGLADARAYLRYWPAGIIAIGALKLWQSRTGGGVMGALVILAAGGWMLAQQLGLIDADLFDLWPLLLVFFGGSMVWRGMRGPRRRDGLDSNATISGLAVLAGIQRGNNSRTFRGGDLTAVMGGCEIDLRQAAIDGEAVIDVFAMWGGIEIRVPEDWTVVGRVVPVLGGFDDKTRPPQGAGAHRLVLRGFAIMGGIEVKN
jgi:hypothetical protein